VNEPRIAILSDQNLFREGVFQLLRLQGFHRVSEYRSAAEFQQSLQDVLPQLVLIDMDHRADEPFALLRELRGRAPGAMVVIIGAAQQGGAVVQAMRPDADTQVLRAALSLARASQEETATTQSSAEAQSQQQLWARMTPRQRDVLGYLSTGSDNLKIAAHLGISERAVKAHVSALLSLFNAENRTELAVLACRAGMRPPLRNMTRPQSLPQAQAS
jgi:DNA-binding NarL/FixJ family response regulator